MIDKEHLYDALKDVDVVDQMEKKFNKPTEQFNDSEFTSLLSATAAKTAIEEALIAEMGDTSRKTTMEEMLNITKAVGFEVAWHDRRLSKHNIYEDEYILCNSEGIVIHMESFDGTRINNMELYCTIRLREKVNEGTLCTIHRICVDGGSYGRDTDMIYTLHVHSCINFKKKLKMIHQIGTVLPELNESFIWFLNYDEATIAGSTREPGYYMNVSLQKIRDSSDTLQRIMKNFLNPGE